MTEPRGMGGAAPDEHGPATPGDRAAGGGGAPATGAAPADPATAPDRDDRGTVEFGERGFPTPPGYPPYGAPPPYAPPPHPGEQPYPDPPPGATGNGPPTSPPAGPGAAGGEGGADLPGEGGTVEFGQAGFPNPPGYPPAEPAPATPPTQPGRRRRRPWVIASIVLGIVLLLCGGGGVTAFLLLRGGGGEGAPDPAAAADSFLRAVYLDRNADEAATLVCPAARDKAKISKKVQEVEGYGKTYPNPRFRWTPPTVTDQNPQRAVVTTKLTMITADERFAEEQLTLTVVDQTGWWVCEVG
ncbi:hypothetical protein ACFFWC_23920 [Plantactinospora siamensis]|uniref:Ig-like domain-containing protein n=1 Tax=Plantactinospora siamensis TaxID=555372 RepID=A0ABV6P530_9ACTN